VILPADDLFHKDIQTENPYWNESAWFPFNIPEKSVNGFVYFYHRPNMKYTTGGVALWDPSGEEMYDCLYYDFSNTFAMPEGCEMFDFALPNGLKVECIEPLKTFKFKYGGESLYSGANCKLDLSWEGILPPYQSGVPENQTEWCPAKAHYDQIGRMKGTVIIDEQLFQIDCLSMRDHSWGPRNLVKNPRGFFTWGITSEKSAFHCQAVCGLPASKDPIAGIPIPVTAGWYLKDGIFGEIEHGECSATERDASGRPLRMELSCVDRFGRKLLVKGKAKTILNCVLYPYLLQWWAQFEWELDGQACNGELLDFLPLQQARTFIRSLKK
jgi:hypothetical protein